MHQRVEELIFRLLSGVFSWLNKDVLARVQKNFCFMDVSLETQLA